MKYKCTTCGKGFEKEDCFSQFFAEKTEEPAKALCDECTAKMLEEVEIQGIGKEELDAEIEKELRDCIL